MMSSKALLILIFIFGGAVVGCSESAKGKFTEQDAIEHVDAPFAQSSISLNIITEPDVNSWNGTANSCTLLIIQAEKSNVLNKVISNPILVKSYFNGTGSFDDILKVDRYSAMPGQQVTLHIDRSEHARHLAIIAGYYPFPSKNHMVIVDIPVITNSEGWWNKKWYAELAPMVMTITLGSQNISQFSGANQQDISLTQKDLIAEPDKNVTITEPGDK